MSTAIVPSVYAFFSVMRTRPSGRCSTQPRRLTCCVPQSRKSALAIALAAGLGAVLVDPKQATTAEVPLDAASWSRTACLAACGPASIYTVTLPQCR